MADDMSLEGVSAGVIALEHPEKIPAFNALDLLQQSPALQERLSLMPWAIEIFSRFNERPGIAWKAAHVVRVTTTALQAAESLGYTEEEKDIIVAAAIVHDSGFVDERIQESTINKEDVLTDSERFELDQHPYYSAEMVSENWTIADTQRQKIARIVAHHHQRQARKPALPNSIPPLEAGDEKFVSLLAASDQADVVASKGQQKTSLNGRPYLGETRLVSFEDAYADVVRSFPGQENMVQNAVQARYQLFAA